MLKFYFNASPNPAKVALFLSAAILLYLSDKTGRFLAGDGAHARAESCFRTS